MAQVPGTSLPSVAPSAAPLPTQQLDAPASAFGANVGAAALGELGQGAEKAGDTLAQYATQFQAINNKQAADDASLKAATALYGMGANYRANNTQSAAFDNLNDFAKDVETTRATFAEGLSPLAKIEFDAASRRSAFGVLSETSNYAAQQRRVAITNTAQATVKLAGDQFVANPGDKDAEAHFVQTLGTQAAQVFQTTGLPMDDPQVREWMKAQASPIYGSMVKQAYDGGDLPRAQALLEQHRNDMTAAEYTTLSGGLRVADHANTIQSAANAMVNGGVAPANRDAVWGAIVQQESGGKVGVAGPMTQYGQAHGSAQVLDSTGQEMAGKLGIPWQPELMRGTTPEAASYQEKIGHAYWDQAMVAEGGDIHRALMYYHGGPDESQWGPKTRAYADAVAAKVPQGTTQAFDRLPISPSMTADEYVANGDAVLQSRAQSMFPSNAADANAAFSAAHQRLMIQAQQIRSAQGAVQDMLQGFVVDNGVTDITAVQKRFPTEWAQLPSKYQMALQRDVQFQGSTPTPERQNNYARYQGMAMSNPEVFADPVKTDLKADQNLTIGDRKSLENLQRQMATSQQAKAERTAKLNTYLSNPVVASVVKSNFPDKGSDEYQAFIGALQGQVDSLQLKEGHSPSQAEISTAAQNLVTRTGGFLGMGAKAPVDVPEDAKSAITAQYQKLYKRNPYPNELSYAYQRGPQYYGR